MNLEFTDNYDISKVKKIKTFKKIVIMEKELILILLKNSQF